MSLLGCDVDSRTRNGLEGPEPYSVFSVATYRMGEEHYRHPDKYSMEL